MFGNRQFALLFTALSLLQIAFSDQINSLNDLNYDENDRLASNVLLYNGDNACTTKIEQENFEFRTKVPVSADVIRSFFDGTPGHCATVCLEIGVPRDLAQHPLRKHVNKSGANFRRFVDENCQRVEVGFVSYHPNELDIMWINHEGARVSTGTLRRGERNTAWQTTILGHRFILVDKVTGEDVFEHVAQHNAIMPLGSYPSEVQHREVTAQVKQTFDMEWRRAHTVTRTFTNFGFDKGRLPDDLWASISAYYYINRNNKIREEWGGKGLYVNWWERDVYFIPMPWQLKVIIYATTTSNYHIVSYAFHVECSYFIDFGIDLLAVAFEGACGSMDRRHRTGAYGYLRDAQI